MYSLSKLLDMLLCYVSTCSPWMSGISTANKECINHVNVMSFYIFILFVACYLQSGGQGLRLVKLC